MANFETRKVLADSENYGSTDLGQWFKDNERFGINIIHEGTVYKVLTILRENDTEIHFITISPNKKPFQVRMLKQHSEESETQTDYETIKLATREVAELEGSAQISLIENLSSFLAANPDCKINITALSPFITHIEVDENILPVVGVLGNGGFGLVVLVESTFYSGTGGEEEVPTKNLIVMKVNLKENEVVDLEYDLKMQALVEDRMGVDYVPQAQPRLYNVGLMLGEDQPAVHRGKAVSMTSENASVLSKWEKSRSDAEQVFVTYKQWAHLAKNQHQKGIVNPDCHAANVLATDRGLKMIDFGQYRAINFNLKLALELLQDNQLNLTEEHKLALATKVFHRLVSMSKGNLAEYAQMVLNNLSKLPRIDWINVISGVQSFVDEKLLATMLTHEISNWIDETNANVNWGLLIKKFPDLWLEPYKGPYITVFNTRSFNFAAALGAVRSNDFVGIAALEQRAKVVELMHALKLPFYTPILDQLNGVELFISGEDWDWGNPNSKIQDIAANAFFTIASRVKEQKVPFVEKDKFINAALDHSLIRNCHPFIIERIWEMLKTYFEEYDEVYVFERMQREKMTYADVESLIDSIFNLVKTSGELITDEHQQVLSGPFDINDDLATVILGQSPTET